MATDDKIYSEFSGWNHLSWWTRFLLRFKKMKRLSNGGYWIEYKELRGIMYCIDQGNNQ